VTSTELLFILLQVAQIIAVFVIIARGIRSDISQFCYEPIYLALFSSSLIHLIVPLLQYLVGYYRYDYTYSLRTQVISNALYLLSVAFLFLGYRIAKKRRPEERRVIGISRNAYIIVVLLIFVPAIYVSFSHVSRIIQFGQLQYLSDRISAGVGRGTTLLLANNIYVAFLFAFAVYLISRKQRRPAILLGITAAGLLFYVVYYYFYTANRNSIFITALGASIIWLAVRQRLSISKISRFLPLLIVFPLALAYLGEQRRAFVSGETVAPLTLETFVRGINGAFGNHENVLWLIENPQTRLKGQSYMAALTNFVPRTFWPNKPLGGGPALKNMIRPGSYIVGEEGNSSLTTGLITEAMMNFGYLGVAAVSFIFGGLLALISNRFNRPVNPIDLVLQAVFILTFAFIVFYSEFLGMVARLALTTLPLIGLSIFLRLLLLLQAPGAVRRSSFQKS
jgi:oligosaccharide repeat unit polymerase